MKIVIILLLALMLRLGAFLAVWHVDQGRIISPDSVTYEAPARIMVEKGWFAHNPYLGMRTPGYPVLIALVYRVFGESRAALMITQIFLSVGTIGLLYVFTRRTCDTRTALGAALFLALDPASFMSSQKYLTETFFTFALVLTLIAGARLVQRQQGSLALAFVTGMLLGFCAHIRPIALYLIWPVSLIIIAIYSHRKIPWYKSAAVLTAMFLPFTALIGTWENRNQHFSGKAVFSHIQNYNLLYYVGGGIIQLRDGLTFRQSEAILRSQLPSLSGKSAGEIDTIYHRQAMAIIKAHPLILVKLHLLGAIKQMTPAFNDFVRYFGLPFQLFAFEDLSLERFLVKACQRPLSIMMLMFEISFSVVLAVGATMSVRRIWSDHEKRATYFLAAIIALYMVACSAGVIGNYRFRVPSMPIIAFFASCGIWGKQTL